MTKFYRIGATERTRIKYRETNERAGIETPRQTTALTSDESILARFARAARGDERHETYEELREPWTLLNEEPGSRSGIGRSLWSRLKRLLRGGR